ncbi:ATP-binding protein [Aneurinibacillus sp. BA2021]|nr:ATP-binding protein [Aneurinibacillus sp. BA2021]
MSKPQMQLEITTHADLSMLELFRHICHCTLNRLVPERSDHVLLAVHELLINSIEASSLRCGTEHTASLTLRITQNEDETEITVEDQAGGIPSEHLAAMKHTAFENILWQERGRGLLFVQALVDEWEYTAQAEGSRFTIRIKEDKK